MFLLTNPRGKSYASHQNLMLINQYNCQQLGPQINTDVRKESNTTVEMEADTVPEVISHLGAGLRAEAINPHSGCLWEEAHDFSVRLSWSEAYILQVVSKTKPRSMMQEYIVQFHLSHLSQIFTMENRVAAGSLGSYFTDMQSKWKALLTGSSCFLSLSSWELLGNLTEFQRIVGTIIYQPLFLIKLKVVISYHVRSVLLRLGEPPGTNQILFQADVYLVTCKQQTIGSSNKRNEFPSGGLKVSAHG